MQRRSRELEFIDQLLGAVRSLIRHHDAAGDAAAYVLERIQQLKKAARLAEATPSSPRVAGGLSRGAAGQPRFEDEAMLRKLARTGVGSMTMTWKKDGSAVLLVDDAVDVRLPCKLAELMKILLVKREADEDGFPAFVGYAALAAMLGRPSRSDVGEPGAPATEHAVTQLVYRLRKIFMKGLNPFFIDTDRKHGVRVLLRKAA